MALTASRLDQLHRTLLEAFTQDEIRRMLRTRIGVSFDHILWVSPISGLDDCACIIEHTTAPSKQMYIWRSAEGISLPSRMMCCALASQYRRPWSTTNAISMIGKLRRPVCSHA